MSEIAVKKLAEMHGFKSQTSKSTITQRTQRIDCGVPGLTMDVEFDAGSEDPCISVNKKIVTSSSLAYKLASVVDDPIVSSTIVGFASAIVKNPSLRCKIYI